MFITLKIPVSDTDYANDHFDYKGDIDDFAIRLKYRQMKRNMDYKFHYVPVKCFVWDADKKEIEIEDLNRVRYSRKRFILTFSIDPEDMNSDASEELKSWIKESNLVWALDERRYSDRDKVKVLPTMQFRLDDEQGHDYILVNSRMIDDLSDNKSHYYFVIIVDRID